jgi:hypothetical protein
MRIRFAISAAIVAMAALPVVTSAQEAKTLEPVAVVGTTARVMVMPGPDADVTVLIPREFEKRATVTVENWRDVEVTLVAQSGVNSRTVGAVPAHSRVTLAVPTALIQARSPIQLAVQTGSLRALVADPLRIDDEDHLAIRVLPQ